MNQFDQHMLPKDHITYKSNKSELTVSSKTLNALIEQLITQVLNHKRTFHDFEILQTKNFNFSRGCGLIVLKFKHYPLVLKLFIESPDTYLDHYCKGIESIAFHSMAGGTNRHLSGLTRIPNLKFMQKRLNSLAQWKDTIVFPRKWFWLPHNPHWIVLTGYHLGNKDPIQTKIPGIYAIIADYIDMKQTIDMPIQEKKRIVMQLCNDVDTFIDPHYTNFSFISDTDKPFKIVIIDTEHFPTIVGLKKKKRFRNHNSWYQYLAGKYIRDTFFRNKKQRLTAHTVRNELRLF